MSHGIGLTTAEIHSAFNAEDVHCPPILWPKDCARMLGESVHTVYFRLESGQWEGAHRRRGKHQLIWRDRVLLLMFNGKAGGKLPFPRPGGPGIGLTEDEINRAFAAPALCHVYPPILGPEQLA